MDDFFKESATWYVDSNSNLVWVKGEEASVVAFVVDSTGTQDGWSNWTYKAKMMTMDGVVTVVDTDDNYSDVNGGSNDLAGKFVKYTVKDGKYTLVDAAAYVPAPPRGRLLPAPSVRLSSPRATPP